MSGARPRWRAWGLALRRYLTFFLTMAFLITCCMTLFISQLQTTLGFAFTQQQLGRAARLTFGNVLLLSLLCTVVDEVRRRFLVDPPGAADCAGGQADHPGGFFGAHPAAWHPGGGWL